MSPDPAVVSEDRLDSTKVYDTNGALEGYALKMPLFTGSTPITPTRCCRTCAWADAPNVRYVPGVGPRYFPPTGVPSA